MPKKLRAQQIRIDLPTEEAAVWVHVVIQSVFKDLGYTTTQTIDRVGYVNRSIDQFAAQITQVVDPVTGDTISISGAGVAQAIKNIVTTWIQQEKGGNINHLGDLILEE